MYYILHMSTEANAYRIMLHSSHHYGAIRWTLVMFDAQQRELYCIEMIDTDLGEAQILKRRLQRLEYVEQYDYVMYDSLESTCSRPCIHLELIPG